MSKLATYTIANRPSASSNAGLMIFRTDTNNFEISDGTDWQTYLSDGVFDVFSNNSYSASFDGTDDVVDISSLTLNADFSYSAWFKFTGTATFQPMIASGTQPNIQTFFSVNSASLLNFGSRTSNYEIISVSGLSSNTWYHAVATLKAGTGRLYLNGIQVGSNTNMQAPNSTSGSQLAIGEAKRVSAHFEGLIDEVAIFNRAITASEVQHIYNNKTYQSPQAMYRFENNFNDETGSYNGTQSGGVSFSSTDKPY